MIFISGIVFILLACLATENYRGQELMDGHRDNHRDGDRETGADTEGRDTARRTGKGLWKTNSIYLYLPAKRPSCYTKSPSAQATFLPCKYSTYLFSSDQTNTISCKNKKGK